VAEVFRRQGYSVISTDDLAKRLMNSDSQLKTALATTFGQQIFSSTGELISSELAAIVFSPDDSEFVNLNKLNRLVHPAVIQAMSEEVERLADSGEKMIFVESALIYEAELEEGFDFIIVVDCNDEIALERTQTRTGLSKGEIKRRQENQISGKQKREAADFVIENIGSIEALEKSSLMVLDILKAIAES